METLLVLAIIVTALAVITQAGILIAMYLMTRRVTNNVNGLMNEAYKLSAPLERIATNFRAASEDVVVIGKNAREEMVRIGDILKDTQTAIHDEILDIRNRVNETVDDLQHTVMRPVRECSAIATGVSVGIRSFFNRKPNVESEVGTIIIVDETVMDTTTPKSPAA